jgi:hypothetical protein
LEHVLRRCDSFRQVSKVARLRSRCFSHGVHVLFGWLRFLYADRAVSLSFSPDDPIVQIMIRYPDDYYKVGLVALCSLYPHDGF